MKATGIVRRIDDLGRVVIPKEIRHAMRIREGDPLEIYTNNEGCVIFRKYSYESDDELIRRQIEEELWGKVNGNEQGINNLISKLRKYLSIDPTIELVTIPRNGYKLSVNLS